MVSDPPPATLNLFISVVLQMALIFILVGYDVLKFEIKNGLIFTYDLYSFTSLSNWSKGSARKRLLARKKKSPS